MTTGPWTRAAAVVLTAVAALFALAVEARASSTDGPDIVRTGQFVPELEPYDRIVARIMRVHRIPGAAVAVARDGRLVYARGFGMADRLREVPVQPDSLFRIASLSKPITAVAVLKLVEDGRLKLDARVFQDLLSGIEPHPPKDPRMNEITVRDLLRHSGGFDRDRSGDIQWETFPVAYPGISSFSMVRLFGSGSRSPARRPRSRVRRLAFRERWDQASAAAVYFHHRGI